MIKRLCANSVTISQMRTIMNCLRVNYTFCLFGYVNLCSLLAYKQEQFKFHMPCRECKIDIDSKMEVPSNPLMSSALPKV